MENLLLILAASLVLRRTTPRKFKSRFIGDTGCSVLVLSNGEFEKTKTASGDDLYFCEMEDGPVSYGVICVNMASHLEKEKAMTMLRHYMNKLRAPLYILHHTGVQEEPDWNTADATTLTNYWQDSDGLDWKVKGYTNGKYLAVLYVKNIGQVAVNKQDLFLDGFHYNACLI